MAEDARTSPWGLRAFALVVLALAYFIISDQGWFQRDPIALTEATLRTDGVYVYYRLEGEKLTAGQLASETAAWIFSDGTPLPTAIYRPNGEVIGDTNAGVLEQGERFATLWFRVPVPAAAHSDDLAELRLCFNFTGHPTFCPVRMLYVDIARGAIPADALDDAMSFQTFESPSISPLR